jgi:hypothetical protein
MAKHRITTYVPSHQIENEEITIEVRREVTAP